MIEQSVLSALETDFDIILVVDMVSGLMQVQKESSKNSIWVEQFDGKSFSDYLDFISQTFLFPEDRSWFCNIFSNESVKNLLNENKVFLLNHRVCNKDGQTIFYQTKIARMSDPPFTKFVMGGHSIDMAERSSNHYYEEAASAHHNAVIASLASDFDLVCYINEHSNEVDIYHKSEVYDSIMKDCNPNLPANKKLVFFFNHFVHPDDYEKFCKESEPQVVKDETSIYPSYEIHFRALISGDVYYYKVKFIPDENNPGGYILGLISFDEQIRSQIQKRESEKARAVMEKQLELMIIERTSEIQSKNKVLNRLNEDIIEMLGDITEARDLESGEHIRRVKGFTHALALQVMEDWPEYGLTKERCDLISSASALHDIGKIMIPDAILLKPGRLSPDEFDIMKTHSAKGCDLLKKAPSDWSSDYLETSMEICHFHHEKWDGKGYPNGLAGDKIPLSAQIVSIADCYDALTAKRVYKEALSAETAYEMITGGQCGLFNPKLMESFLKCKAKFTDQKIVANTYYNIVPVDNIEKLSKLRVLFVEDNEMSRMIGREMLEGEGANVVEAENGKIAFELFTNMDPGTFDAIVMDVNMPVMDGPEATRHIRSMDRSDASKIPIIALTASEEVEDLQRCLDAGMNCYLSKPVKIAELTEILLRLTKKKKRQKY